MNHSCAKIIIGGLLKNYNFVLIFILTSYSNLVMATEDKCKLSFESAQTANGLVFFGKTEGEVEGFKLIDDDGLLTLSSITKKIYNRALNNDGTFSSHIELEGRELNLAKLSITTHLTYLNKLKKLIYSDENPNLEKLAAVKSNIVDSEIIEERLKSYEKMRIPLESWKNSIGAYLEEQMKIKREYGNLNLEPKTINSGCGGQIVVPTTSSLCFLRSRRPTVRCMSREAKNIPSPPMVLSRNILCSGGYRNPSDIMDSNFCVEFYKDQSNETNKNSSGSTKE